VERYTYFPGCSLESTASNYDRSARAVMRALGYELAELPDWNCCGATGADVLSHLLSLALPARNLAKAQNLGDQIVTTCSSCYLNLFRVNAQLASDPALQRRLDEVLGEVGLRYVGGVRVRHLLELLVTDVGLRAIAQRVERRLGGLRVAPYYGCLVVRPYAEFDGPDLPISMDRLLTALGASVIPYAMKTRCCGGVLMTTQRPIALKLVADLLEPVRDADCVVTVCPLCQLNLEAYQREVGRQLGGQIHIPILYFTQLMGLAFALPDSELDLDANLVGTDELMHQIGRMSAWV
jgi:heterodisulfide reductase subunit B2